MSSVNCDSFYRICLISDFFYPRLGGVELHQYQLAAALRRRGHHVIVVTGTYEDKSNGVRQGIRIFSGGIRVYYLPIMSLHQQASLPNLFCAFPLFRQILLRERIQLVHGHQSTSALSHEALLHARTMGLATVYTEHSLFGFSNAPAVNLNKFAKFTLTDVQQVICVSHCQKENVCIRAFLDPMQVAVIPNAVDTTNLQPNPDNAPDINEIFTIVVLSRLVYRKGMDLLLEVIPAICARFPQVHFLIGGDGPKRLALDEMRERYRLQDRVECIGAVSHADVSKVLTRGHLFLNASLTESFCIAILEAVSCGLYVVSTRVGGVPEILPSPDFLCFADPVVSELIEAVSTAIPTVMKIAADKRAGGLKAFGQRAHEYVKNAYNWHEVSARTEKIYSKAITMLKEQYPTPEVNALLHREKEQQQLARVRGRHRSPLSSTTDDDFPSFPSSSTISSSSEPVATSAVIIIPSDHGSFFGISLDRVQRFLECGPFAGWLFVLIIILDHWIWRWLEYVQPRGEIDPSIDPGNLAAFDVEEELAAMQLKVQKACERTENNVTEVHEPVHAPAAPIVIPSRRSRATNRPVRDA